MACDPKVDHQVTVAHEGALRPMQTKFLPAGLPPRYLCFGDTPEDMPDPQISGARSDDPRGTSADDGEFEAGLLQQLEAEAVLNVESSSIRSIVGVM